MPIFSYSSSNRILYHLRINLKLWKKTTTHEQTILFAYKLILRHCVVKQWHKTNLFFHSLTWWKEIREIWGSWFYRWRQFHLQNHFKPKPIYHCVNDLEYFFFLVLICLSLEIPLLPNGIEAISPIERSLIGLFFFNFLYTCSEHTLPFMELFFISAGFSDGHKQKVTTIWMSF